MTDYKVFFKNKKITVMGLGLLGRGVGDVAFLAQCGAKIVVTDKKSREDLQDSVAKLSAYPNVTFKLGGHEESDFTNGDMVFKAAGVPKDSTYIQAAMSANVPVYMSTALFAKFAMESGVTIIGITGTRGKSTTTMMIYSVIEAHLTSVLTAPCACSLKHLSDAPLPSSAIFLGGNVRGVSTLALLPSIKAGDVVVLELDSWQLQGFGDLHISPNISVFTNLMPDHQNYYKDMDDYFADKANIFLNQKAGDTLVCGEGILERILGAKPPVSPLVPEPIPVDWSLKIPGEHNRENAALAAEALRALDIPEDEIKQGLESFEGVEGRLQLVREVNGVKIYNDNNATTPDATIAALKALSVPRHGSGQNRNIVLILGGADKGLDMSNLLYEITKSCKRVICLAGTGTARTTPFMQDFSLYDNLASAVQEAVASAQAGDTILFSPAFASFGMFKNEYERNDEFVSIINDIL